VEPNPCGIRCEHPTQMRKCYIVEWIIINHPNMANYNDWGNLRSEWSLTLIINHPNIANYNDGVICGVSGA